MILIYPQWFWTDVTYPNLSPPGPLKKDCLKTAENIFTTKSRRHKALCFNIFFLVPLVTWGQKRCFENLLYKGELNASTIIGNAIFIYPP